MVETTGKAHNQRFKVSCQVEPVNKNVLGSGTSRRKAEQDAADKMYQIIEQMLESGGKLSDYKRHHVQRLHCNRWSTKRGEIHTFESIARPEGEYYLEKGANHTPSNSGVLIRKARIKPFMLTRQVCIKTRSDGGGGGAINRLMNRAASSSIGDVELVLFVVEGTKWTADDDMVLEKLQQAQRPVVLNYKQS